MSSCAALQLPPDTRAPRPATLPGRLFRCMHGSVHETVQPRFLLGWEHTPSRRPLENTKKRKSGPSLVSEANATAGKSEVDMGTVGETEICGRWAGYVSPAGKKGAEEGGMKERREP